MKAASIHCFIILLMSPVFSQMRVIYPDSVKGKDVPLPTFPTGAAKLIYGDEVRVLLDVDKSGKVNGALAYGPLAPCSDLSDPVVESVRKAALASAKATTFEIGLKDDETTGERVSIGYRLRPLALPLSDEEKRIVSIGVANSRASSLPRPEYPEAARSRGLKGAISVLMLIDESGSVISAAAISGHPVFSEAGVRAACSARFPPMTLKSQPAKMLGAVTYNFAP